MKLFFIDDRLYLTFSEQLNDFTVFNSYFAIYSLDDGQATLLSKTRLPYSRFTLAQIINNMVFFQLRGTPIVAVHEIVGDNLVYRGDFDCRIHFMNQINLLIIS